MVALENLEQPFAERTTQIKNNTRGSDSLIDLSEILIKVAVPKCKTVKFLE